MGVCHLIVAVKSLTIKSLLSRLNNLINAITSLEGILLAFNIYTRHVKLMATYSMWSISLSSAGSITIINIYNFMIHLTMFTDHTLRVIAFRCSHENW